MGMSIEEFEKQALALPIRERALLATCLIQSLDDIDDPEAERLWAEEAGRRYSEYKAGRIPARDINDALEDARADLK